MLSGHVRNRIIIICHSQMGLVAKKNYAIGTVIIYLLMYVMAYC